MEYSEVIRALIEYTKGDASWHEFNTIEGTHATYKPNIALTLRIAAEHSSVIEVFYNGVIIDATSEAELIECAEEASKGIGKFSEWGK